ncbi:lipoamide acyltransferase component of branched-chain alpha-keto acid dehydrogenase complex, mitochondrial isoform X1 [Agrilus planipennis]|uniref:Dihydrolipoamide acetyltransferase component of pyruvate dehydrogenase complex n=1 Tax=Agrilus planipennis TaxID=224129 RepID=A0A7F5RHH7_AGRPL|nr:lipoamide acyltransferase component of branched-chain alpha-keto acid dehydrogenase complex, mitochondrial isoform X1 [Agrilus planipennis]
MQKSRRAVFILNQIFANNYTNFNNNANLFRLERNGIFFKRNFFLARTVNALVQFNLTDIGEGITEVVVKEWFVKEGEQVSQFDNICEVQSDKASVTITSRYDGIIKKLHYQVDDTAYVGKPLIDIETKEEINNEERTKKVNPLEVKQNVNTNLISESTVQTEQLQNSTVLSLPSVRRLAKEKNVDLLKVIPTGKGGRILKEDVLKYIGVQTVSKNEKEKIIPLTGFQPAMFKAMTAALKIPHLVYCEEITATKLLEVLKLTKREYEESKIKVTLTAFLIKAVSNALQKYPILNASINEDFKSLTIKHYHNIGVAMDTAQGLGVPVIKEVENKDIKTIALELEKLSKSGKKGSFSKEDLSDGTFSLSNIGSIGGTYASPVILPPQLGIVAFGTVKVLPRFNDKMEVVKESVLWISASADHRVIDGATIARFVETIKREIESPQGLIAV